MTLEEMKQKFQDWKFAASAYQMAITIISIDKLTVAPPAGAAYRDAREASGHCRAVQKSSGFGWADGYRTQRD